MYRISALLHRAADLWPNQEAVVDSQRSFSYKELLERSERLAQLLQKQGLESGDVVSIISPNSHYFLESYFACALAGLVLNPINFRLAPREVAAILQDANSKLLLVHSDFLALAFDSVQMSVQASEKITPTFELSSVEDEAFDRFDSPAVSANINELAHLYYTSGTTGQPKGVMLTHTNVVTHALCTIAELHLTDEDVWLHAAPMFHLADAWATFAITAVGGKHVILPYFQPRQCLEIIEQQHITISNLIPTMLNAMINHNHLTSYDYSSLRLVLSGGAPISPDTVRRIVQAFGCQYVQTYGMTETSPYLTFSIPKVHMNDWKQEDIMTVRSKTGRSFMGVELRVVRENGCEVAPDNAEVGEIIVRGETVTPGYWHKSEETAKTIKNGWLHTGDLAVIDAEGYVNIVDRKKDMIITGGENVYSTEVEHVLYEHAAVQECAVFGIPDVKWGEAVTAAVVLRTNHTTTAEELIEFTKERIAHYKAPRTVRFLNELPKTGSGKIQKKALREL